MARKLAWPKFVNFGLTLELFERVREEARQQKVSVGELVRRALEYYLRMRINPLTGNAWVKDFPATRATPFYWTKEEQEYAHRVIQRHFDEDRYLPACPQQNPHNT